MSEEKKNLNKKEMTDEELDKVAGGWESPYAVVKTCGVARVKDLSLYNGSIISEVGPTHLNACVKASTGLDVGYVFRIDNQFYYVVKVVDSFGDPKLDNYGCEIVVPEGRAGKCVEVIMFFHHDEM